MNIGNIQENNKHEFESAFQNVFGTVSIMFSPVCEETSSVTVVYNPKFKENANILRPAFCAFLLGWNARHAVTR